MDKIIQQASFFGLTNFFAFVKNTDKYLVNASYPLVHRYLSLFTTGAVGSENTVVIYRGYV